MEPIKRDTTEKLFKAVLSMVKNNGHYDAADAIMDYVIPSEREASLPSDVIELSNYQFDFVAIPSFGGSEGIYIDC